MKLVMQEQKNSNCTPELNYLLTLFHLKKNIIITGSHGKTTTTSLVAKILSDQKLDPLLMAGLSIH